MNIRYRLQDYINLPTHTAMGISFGKWMNLLWKNKFAIDVQYWPKALFIALTVILNIPFQVLEKIRFNGKIKNTKVQPPVFILGHPRSGTTFLQYVLSKDPNFAFCTTTEGLLPNIFLTGGSIAEKLLAAAMPATRPQDNVKAGASLPIEEEFAMGNISNTSWVHGLYFPRNIYKWFDNYVTFKKGDNRVKQHWKDHFDFFLKKLSLRYPGKSLLLKSPANTGRLKELYELYPNAKFIHIYRDPFKVYLSNERLYEKILPIIGFQKVSNAFMQEHILYAYEEMYRKYLTDRILIPHNQIIEFSYEDFIKSPEETMKKTYEHLELGSFEKVLPFFKTELQSTEDYKPNSYLKMDEALRVKIVDRWKFAFDVFGYSTDLPKLS
jgi:omega-hydroxy-beta-dihydromenaquinone-9 sulfotransferase